MQCEDCGSCASGSEGSRGGKERRVSSGVMDKKQNRGVGKGIR